MSGDAPQRPKLRALDYIVLFGAPVAFFLVAFFGLRAVVGPVPQPNPVQRIKDGEVKSGDGIKEVLKLLGQPKSISPKEDGGVTVIYTRTVADGDFQLEEGVITVDPGGHVIEAHVDRQLATKPAS